MEVRENIRVESVKNLISAYGSKRLNYCSSFVSLMVIFLGHKLHQIKDELEACTKNNFEVGHLLHICLVISILIIFKELEVLLTCGLLS